MKTLRMLVIGMVMAAALQWAPAARATIVGSAHDFSTNSWNTRQSLCSICHTIHGATAQLVPLWTHETTHSTFTPYTSSTLNSTVGQPDGAALACLSCHDGTVAINSYGGRTNGTPAFVTGNAVIGTDLSKTHPVSFTFDSTLAAGDPGLNDPAVKTVPSLGGKTIAQTLLRNGKVQCVSCHDPHKTIGYAPSSGIMLKITTANGALCLTCHNK